MATRDGIASIQIWLKLMAECPCCSEKLLRHVRQGKVYWFCTHCWQEMPNLEDIVYQAVLTPKERVLEKEVVLT